MIRFYASMKYQLVDLSGPFCLPVLVINFPEIGTAKLDFQPHNTLTEDIRRCTKAE